MRASIHITIYIYIIVENVYIYTCLCTICTLKTHTHTPVIYLYRYTHVRKTCSDATCNLCPFSITFQFWGHHDTEVGAHPQVRGIFGDFRESGVVLWKLLAVTSLTQASPARNSMMMAPIPGEKWQISAGGLLFHHKLAILIHSHRRNIQDTSRFDWCSALPFLFRSSGFAQELMPVRNVCLSVLTVSNWTKLPQLFHALYWNGKRQFLRHMLNKSAWRNETK
jgi:hypothetical protein